MKNQPAQAILTAISHPTRMELLHRLMEGAASVSELISVTGSSQSNVSNHLAILRNAGLVLTQAQGRYRKYQVSNPAVASLIESILVLSDPPSARSSAAISRARTCYDHLAGRLGVGIFRSLDEQKVFRRVGESQGSLMLTSKGEDLFAGLEVDLETLYRKRRRFAFECIDWTEKSAHLGGSLGAALCQLLVRNGWITRNPVNRSIRTTRAGLRALENNLGVDVSGLNG